MKNLTPEMIEKAKAAKSAEELLEIAKANGVEMTAEEAATYFAQLNPKSGELDDDDLDNVAGGGCGSSDDNTIYEKVRVTSGETCPKCGTNIVSLLKAPEWSTNGPYFHCKTCKKRVGFANRCTYEVIG
jgi:predicted ribosomally synthesized peptide with nif11-like leader